MKAAKKTRETTAEPSKPPKLNANQRLDMSLLTTRDNETKDNDTEK